MAFATRSFGFSYSLTPVVKRLLITNLAIFFVTAVLGPQGRSFVIEWFAFQPTLELLSRPWVPVTYMFLHADVMHLAVNMLILFFFGPPLEARWGGREFLYYYIACGLGGAALSFVFQPVSIIGASGALLGVMLAFAMNWPNAPIYVWGIFPIQASGLLCCKSQLCCQEAMILGHGSLGAVNNIAHQLFAIRQICLPAIEIFCLFLVDQE
jgi:membrane associated rhomboid family serine protease